jgi:ribonucleotide monophosphatase NagD (HAD superfamily)
MGKKVFYVTNGSGKTREDLVTKFEKLGHPGALNTQQMYGSAYVTAQYLKRHHPEITKVRVVGMNTLKTELARVGKESDGGEDEIGHLSFDEIL